MRLGRRLAAGGRVLAFPEALAPSPDPGGGDSSRRGAVNLAPGDELRVRLEGRADALWAVAFSDAEVIRALPADAAAADPGFQTFRFQAAALGSSSRAWSAGRL
jgi:hypothetical protein